MIDKYLNALQGFIEGFGIEPTLRFLPMRLFLNPLPTGEGCRNRKEEESNVRFPLT